MNLQATERDAKLTAFAPFLDRQRATSILKIAGYAGTVTVQFQNSVHLVDATGFSRELSLLGRQMLIPVERVASTLIGKLEDIRHAFGLNIKQLAAVMLVSRVTVYDWMRQDNLSILRDSARLRLNHLHMLAMEWRHLESIPGDYLNEPLADQSGTLESILMKDVLPTPMRLTGIHQLLLMVQSREERRAAFGAQQSAAIAKGATKILANPHKYGLETD